MTRIILLSYYIIKCHSECISTNQRPGRASCFSDRHEKHKLGRGRWDLVSCQVSLNSVQWFHRRSRKCLSQSGTGRPSCFSDQHQKTQTWRRTLRSCFLWSFIEIRSTVSEMKSKMYQPIRGQSGYLVFPIGPKNTNLVDEDEILLPVKFRRIPFRCFREEVEMYQPIRGRGGHLVFSGRPEKHKLGRGRWAFGSD